MNSVGVDIHKTRCNACIKTSEGKILEEFTFQNDSPGLEELIKHLNAHLEVQVALESTGNLRTRIYDRLEQEQIRVILTNPKKTKALTENKTKTDRIDARLLADLLRSNLLTPSYIPPHPHPTPQIRPETTLHRPVRKAWLEWLSNLQLQPGDRTILTVNLDQLSSLNHSIDRITETIAASAVDNPEVKLLMGSTGVD